MINRAIYVGMTGAKHMMLEMQRTANNLANVNTTGFRGDLSHFTSVPVKGDGYASRIYSHAESSGISFEKGAITTTGRNLDVAVQGDGWIAVHSKSGKEAYVRSSSLSITQQGLLTTHDGHVVLGNQGPITIPPSEKITIGVDGTITVKPSGQDENALEAIDRIKLVNPSEKQLIKGADGLIYSQSGQATLDSSVQLISGALESSNVNVIDALVSMIEVSRNFEIQMKMMQTVDENANSATQLLRPIN